MPLLKTLAIFAFCWLSCLPAFAQLKVPYPLQKDDTLVRRHYVENALVANRELISSLSKEYKSDRKKIYEQRMENVTELLNSRRIVTEKTANDYLAAVLKKVIDANPELRPLKVRMLFSRDAWPNAYSIGEGTIVFNAALFVYLQDEAELAFIICHELAHFYLDHSNKAILKNVALLNSAELKKEAKEISRQQYGMGKRYEELAKKLTFDDRRHSRGDEAEADRQAFSFMKNTGYDCHKATTTLELLGKIDDTSLYKPVKLNEVFHFKEYPFKAKWLQKESSIFSSMSKDDSPLSKAEKDSLRTHPDCDKRIRLLEDSLKKVSGGQRFLVNEQAFQKLKKDFAVEMAEQLYHDKNFGANLYFCLQMLQKPEYKNYAAFGVVRALNQVYEHQKSHKLGMVTDKETRTYREDYNLLLRMIDRLKLDEIANLAYFFAKHHQQELQEYDDFLKEIHVAEKFKSLH